MLDWLWRKPEPPRNSHDLIILRLLETIMADLAALTAAVAANTAAVADVTTVVNDLKNAAGTDQASVDAITGQITQNNTALEALKPLPPVSS